MISRQSARAINEMQRKTFRECLLRVPRGNGSRRVRAQADRGRRKNLAVPDAERADPALAAGDVADEGAELDELRLREVRVQLLPHAVVGERGVPTDRVRVPEGDTLALREERRRLVPVEARELVLLGCLLSRPDSALVPSVVAFERLRHAQAAELLQVQIDDAALEQALPRVDEGAEHFRLLGAHGLDLGPRRAVQHRVLERRPQLGIVELVGVDVADSRHRSEAYLWPDAMRHARSRPCAATARNAGKAGRRARASPPGAP